MAIKRKTKNFFEKVPFKLQIILIIVVLILLTLTKNIIVQVGLFLFCLIFMIRFGAGMMLDVDPVPFSALLLAYLYDPLSAIYFVLIAQPIIDLLSGRFNHYSIINFVSIITTILLFSFIFPVATAITYGIIVFNLLRTILNIVVGFGPQTAMFNIVHAIIYFVLGSVLSFFI